MRSRSSSLVFVATFCTACAGGGGGRDPGDTETEGDELGSSEGTLVTIDPTAFSTTSPSTTVADDSTSAPSSTVDDTSDSTPADSSASSTGGEGPTVVEITPADGTDAIEPDTTITLQFSDAMDPASIIGDDGSCSGAVLLSRDDFATCTALDAATASEGDTVFELAPSDTLVGAGEYRVRVSPAATAADGTPLGATFQSDGFRVRYFHSIAVDGDDDWNGDETFPTSTNGHTAYTAWDDEFVYLGMRSPDVAGGNGQVWVVAYFGGDAGTPDGVVFNTQQPELPFAAQWHLRWRADNTFTESLAWDGDAWASPAWPIAKGDVYQQGELLELRVARADIGDPDLLELHMGIVREADLDEASWAAHPDGSYVDGYDPDYSEYWAFDLLGSDTPAQHVPES